MDGIYFNHTCLTTEDTEKTECYFEIEELLLVTGYLLLGIRKLMNRYEMHDTRF